jgi:hypothetical protein
MAEYVGVEVLIPWVFGKKAIAYWSFGFGGTDLGYGILAGVYMNELNWMDTL